MAVGVGGSAAITAVVIGTGRDSESGPWWAVFW